MQNRSCHAAIAALLLLAGSPTAAEVIYDTYVFGPAPLGRPDRLVGVPPQSASNVQYADSFVFTGNARPLERITLRLSTKPPDGTAGTDLVVRFREDDGGLPGTVLETWIVPAGEMNLTDYAFDSVVAPFLLDGNAYWINVASDTASGRGSWATADTDTLDWLFASTRVEDPAWQMPAPGGALSDLGLATVEVPEPGPVLLQLAAALLLPGLVGLRRWRR